MSQINVMTIFGTRPEAIKLGPIIHRLKSASDHFSSTVVVTGQHRTMLDQMLEVLRITPDADLDIMEANQSLFQITKKTLERLEAVMLRHEPQVILVQGDTTSTFVGALAGYYRQVKVAHLEAGLRTHQKYSPYPEEINRRLTSVLADLHFAPTLQAKQNLLNEGVNPEHIFVTGNTAVDAVLAMRDELFELPSPLRELLDCQRRTIVVTAHRRENWGASFESIAQSILQLATLYRDVQFVFPVHLNPQVRKVFHEKLQGHEQIHLIEPLDYRSFIHLLNQCFFILTDSGGIQEEAPSLRKPVLVMREVTERPEGLVGGWLKLVGCDSDRIVNESRRLLDEPAYYKKATSGKNPYGDGFASQRVLDALRFYFDQSIERPKDFSGD